MASEKIIRKGSSPRIMGELKKFAASKHTNLFLKPLNDNITELRALIIKENIKDKTNKDSVYEGGFFFFNITLNNFPQDPPRLKFTSPFHGERLHPNLYQDGKVCLSILNTWGNNEWSPILTLENILLTIQSLLDENPICHEPILQKCTLISKEAKDYATISRWLTLVNVEHWIKNGHPIFDKEIKEFFIKNYKVYQDSIEKLRPYDKQIISSLHNSCVKIDLNVIANKFENIYKKLTEG